MTDRIVQIVTAFLALWGAILSTVIFVIDRRESSPDIRVNPAYLVDYDETGQMIPQIGIEVINYGAKRVTLEQVGFGWEDPITFVMPDGARIQDDSHGWSNGRAIGTPELPFDLEPGKSKVYWHDLEMTIIDLERIAPEKESSVLLMAEDQTKNMYFSYSMSLDQIKKYYEYGVLLKKLASGDSVVSEDGTITFGGETYRVAPRGTPTVAE